MVFAPISVQPVSGQTHIFLVKDSKFESHWSRSMPSLTNGHGHESNKSPMAKLHHLDTNRIKSRFALFVIQIKFFKHLVQYPNHLTHRSGFWTRLYSDLGSCPMEPTQRSCIQIQRTHNHFARFVSSTHQSQFVSNFQWHISVRHTYNLTILIKIHTDRNWMKSICKIP